MIKCALKGVLHVYGDVERVCKCKC